jgi:hypothetical protein
MIVTSHSRLMGLHGLGDVINYDVIVVGGQKYTANQIVDKQLIAKGPVYLFRGNDFNKPYTTIPSGGVIGKVYSYIRIDQATGQIAKSPLLMFFDSAGKAYYTKDDSKIDTSFLKDQGTLTVAQETQKQQEEKEKAENPIAYYVKKLGLPVLLIGGAIYLAGTFGKEVIKDKLSKPAPSLAGTKKQKRKK